LQDINKESRNISRKIVDNITALIILAYIKQNESDEVGITKDSVAKYMHDKGFCSRPTTLRLIDSLFAEGFLVDRRTRKNVFHDLVVHKDLDFDDLVKKSLLQHVKEVEKELKPFESLTRHKRINLDLKI
jgi:hypothetical protein